MGEEIVTPAIKVTSEQVGRIRANASSVRRGVIAVAMVGALLTASLVWTSWTIDRHNEQRLLTLQAKQVQSVLVAAIPSTQIPLELGAEVAASSGGDITKFQAFMTPQVGTRGHFSSATLWQDENNSVSEISGVGNQSQQHPSQAEVAVRRAFESSTFVVTQESAGSQRFLGYAVALPGSGRRFAVYALRPLPADRKSRVAQNSAFSDLDYAIYLGRAEDPGSLLTTDIDHFPFSGSTATVTVPFGDTVLTTVVRARGPLGGSLSADLPWVVGVVGLFLTIGAAWLAARLMRRRHAAEVAEGAVRDANDELARLYGEQRTIAETLQRALLPQSLPDIPGLEIAARYLPGAQGVEIGGDWYSVLPLSGERFVFVVGDVSGRGVAAASIMARLRFTVRAHALDGDSPADILDKCTRQLDVQRDGHFATVLIGIYDATCREITLANAGHLCPLLLEPSQSRFVEMTANRPIGITGGHYQSVTISIGSSTTLLAFTDGLVERRDEILDVGLKRLMEAALVSDGQTLDGMIDYVLNELDAHDREDDIAILGLRWVG